MKQFVIQPTKKALLFPYARGVDRFDIITPELWRRDYPLAWAYLNHVKSALQARERGRMAERRDWYAYIYPKNFLVMASPKLVIPDISEHMQVAIDFKGEFIFSGGAAGGNAIVPHRLDDMLLLSGILNSTLIEACLKQSGTKFRGGYL